MVVDSARVNQDRIGIKQSVACVYLILKLIYGKYNVLPNVLVNSFNWMMTMHWPCNTLYFIKMKYLENLFGECHCSNSWGSCKLHKCRFWR